MGLIDYIEIKRKERVRRQLLEDSKKVSLGVVLGVALGTAAGLLFAPQSGEETRADIVRVSRDATEKVRKNADSALQTIQSKTGEVVGKARHAFEDHVESRFTKIHPVADEVSEGTEAIAKDLQRGAENVAEDIKDTKEDVEKELKK